MSLSAIIQKRYVPDTSLLFRWDDWEPEKAWEPLDKKLVGSLSKVSDRGNAALCIACGEWVAERFRLLDQDPRVPEFLEASWFGVVNFRYRRYFEPRDEEWQGPIRGPLASMIGEVAEVTRRAADGDSPFLNAAAVAGLAVHIMTDPRPFIEWREWAVETLRRLYPLNEDDTLGDVVPQEALDPDSHFTVDMTEGLIRRLLASSGPGTNRFLWLPDAMRDAGFEGTPYTFSLSDVDQDRF